MPSNLLLFLALLAVFAIVVALVVRRNARRELPPSRPAERLPEPVPAEERPEAEAPEGEEPEGEEPEGEEPEEEPPAPPQKPAGKDLKAGLQKTRSGLLSRLAGVFGGKKTIDASTLERLEEVLLTADIGVKTAGKLFDAAKKELARDELADADAIWAQIRSTSRSILDVGAPPLDLDAARPLVILTIGVNGVGKTTTIGKLASKYSALGKKVLLAAGDTFRAAATAQLEIWGQRTGCPVVTGKEGGDPSSVIFDAVRQAVVDGYDIVIADTAGRLHTKTNLMEELQKVRRVTDKAMPGAPHEVLLVLDSTTGQNAIAQAKLFQEAMAITGIVLTKLDGTAKGGVILGICDELKVPVRYVGIGERVEDLREFDPAEFVEALYDQADAGAA